MNDIDDLDKLSLSQIQDDVETVEKLVEFIANKPYASIFDLGFLPYLSLCVYESCSLVQKIYPDINVNYNVGFSLKDVRLKTKIFEDKLSQNMRFVKNIDYIQNEEYRNQIYSQADRDSYKYYNIGLNIINSNHIIGNTHLYYYYLQPTNLKKKDLSEVMKLYIKGKIDNSAQIKEKVYGFSYNCGQLIKKLVYKLSDFSTSSDLNLHDENFDLGYKDLNTNLNINIFQSNNGKILTLYLLHILCMINYVIYMLNKILPDSQPLCLRIKYICCYYSIMRLEKIYKCMKTHNLMTDKMEYYFKNIDINDKTLFNKSFRSCMMHYGLKDDLGRAYMSANDINMSEPFFGLIEKYYNKDYYELSNSINNKLNKISSALEGLLPIKINNLDRFY